MDDRRVGQVLRALRRRRGWRQLDLARAGRVSQSVVSRIERGHLESSSLRLLRRLFSALDAQLDLDIRWRGGELDRVRDARHAALAMEVARIASATGWSVHQEATFSIYGERGSIDVLAVRQDERSAVAVEVKTELASWEETQRRLDAKTRLLPEIVFQRFGWRPATTSAVLVLEESMTNRRRVAMLGAAVDAAYLLRGRAIRHWLSAPAGDVRGLWFLSPSAARTGRGRPGGFHRVRCASARARRSGASVGRAAEGRSDRDRHGEWSDTSPPGTR